MNHATLSAINSYKRLRSAEESVQREQADLDRFVVVIPQEDMIEYVRETDKIDRKFLAKNIGKETEREDKIVSLVLRASR